MLDEKITSVSKEYADALFDFAKTNNEIELVETNLNTLVTSINENEDFLKIMLSRVIKKEEKKEVLKKVLNNENDYFIHFLFVLIDNNRFDELASINLAYKESVLDYFNKMTVEVYTKYELTEEQNKKLIKKLENKFKKNILINYHIDNTLIGGIKVVSKNKVFDYSIDSQLNELKENIMKG